MKIVFNIETALILQELGVEFTIAYRIRLGPVHARKAFIDKITLDGMTITDGGFFAFYDVDIITTWVKCKAFNKPLLKLVVPRAD